MNKVERENLRIKLIEDMLKTVGELTVKVESLITKLEERDARESSESHSTNSKK